MNWRDHIHSDPAILGGKPVFRDSRIAVELVLRLMGAGWSVERMAAEYPGIVPDHVRAAAAFAAHLIEDEAYIAIGQAQAA